MTDDSKTATAVAGPVERGVRPAAWMVRQGMRTYYVSDAEFVRSSYDTGSFTPLYAPDALAIERKRWQSMLLSAVAEAALHARQHREFVVKVDESGWWCESKA